MGRLYILYFHYFLTHQGVNLNTFHWKSWGLNLGPLAPFASVLPLRHEVKASPGPKIWDVIDLTVQHCVEKVFQVVEFYYLNFRNRQFFEEVKFSQRNLSDKKCNQSIVSHLSEVMRAYRRGKWQGVEEVWVLPFYCLTKCIECGLCRLDNIGCLSVLPLKQLK